MNTSSIQNKKYRPVLTASTLLHLYELVEASYKSNGDSISFQALSELRKYKIKIESGLLQEAYTPSILPNSASLLTDLGGSTLTGKSAWEKYLHHAQNTEGGPLAVLSETEIDIALEYAYNKGLLNEEEKQMYELKLAESMLNPAAKEAKEI